MNKPILSKHIPQDEHINTVAAIFLLSALPQNVVRAEHDSGCARTQFWYTSLGRTRPEHSELTKEIHSKLTDVHVTMPKDTFLRTFLEFLHILEQLNM